MKPLTPQEIRILNLISQGHSSGQIAYTLNISTHTVETHRKNLLIKLEAKNSAELIRKAIQTKAISLHHNE
jgi:DNA-binding CsgD family transcriptional regulator